MCRQKRKSKRKKKRKRHRELRTSTQGLKVQKQTRRTHDMFSHCEFKIESLEMLAQRKAATHSHCADRMDVPRPAAGMTDERAGKNTSFEI